MPSYLVSKAARKLAEQKLTIAFAESATAGRAAAEFALTEQSGKILKGGLVCYDAIVKEDILGIPASMIEKYTPESKEITQELCVRLNKLFKADVYVAITGLTTPGGSETPEKPVGTMFAHIRVAKRDVEIREAFKGSAEEIVLQTIDKISENLIYLVERV